MAIRQYLLCSMAATLLYAAMTNPAHASLCTMLVTEVFSNGLASAVATVGVLLVGGGAALGRVSWTLALTVSCGIAIMFAARSVAGSFGGGC